MYEMSQVILNMALKVSMISRYLGRRKIGYVMQSNSMMSGTIRDNILYGINRHVSDEELIECY